MVNDMRIARIEINNFRGIDTCELFFPEHAVLVGDNNSGKSTILEAIDLVLGPQRLSQRSVIDEHDFHAGRYLDSENNPVDIIIEVVVVDLTPEQERHFKNHLEFWDESRNQLIEGPPPSATDASTVKPALRLGFRGYYDAEEDDFAGETYFLSPAALEDGSYLRFGTQDKRKIGFLFLRTLRTGRRALSLEKGSLLDIIIKLEEIKPQMWEDVLAQLHGISVATEPEIRISDILKSVQDAVRKIVPIECADSPSLKVSNLTRDHLRQVLTVFMGTGIYVEDGSEYLAPFTNQGTGTINVLVLTLLSMIAELKQNVIFAMEEPEIAIPPHTQKRVIRSVVSKSSQSIFTSHSPYVLEEFSPNQIISIHRNGGVLTGIPMNLPPSVKRKAYRDEVKRRFCETILSRRVLIVEGRTEYDAIRAVAGRLEELEPNKFVALDGLGISIIDAQGDSQIAPLGKYFEALKKNTFAIFDNQDENASKEIADSVDYPYESPEKGIENVILKGSKINALRRYALSLGRSDEISDEEIAIFLKEHFKSQKGSGAIADFLSQCTEEEMPDFLVETVKDINLTIQTRINAPESKNGIPESTEEGD